jgi:hypothetical protein
VITQTYISRAQYEVLADDPRFWSAVTFSRVVNSLRVSVYSPAGHLDPAHEGLIDGFTTGQFLYLAANLYEALQCPGKLGKHFKELPAYRVLNDFVHTADLMGFRADVLKPIRNKVVFHFDPDVVATAAGRYPWANFVLEQHRESSHPFYPFADIAVIYSILIGDSEPQDFIPALNKLIEGAARFARSYLVHADCFLHDAFVSLGARQRPEPEGPTKW